MCNSFNISGYFLNSNILMPFQTRTTTIEPFATHVLKKVIASWSLWPFCLYSRISVCLTNTPSTLNVVWVGLGASFFAMIQIINARQFNGERVSSIPSRHYFANVDSNCVRHKKARQVCTYLTYQTKTKCYFLHDNRVNLHCSGGALFGHEPVFLPFQLSVHDKPCAHPIGFCIAEIVP